jgi:hypothetical protein
VIERAPAGVMLSVGVSVHTWVLFSVTEPACDAGFNPNAPNSAPATAKAVRRIGMLLEFI